MADNLKVALVQTDLYWQDPVANLAHLEETIWSLDQAVDLIILPEMFPTGFSMNAAEMAEPMNFRSSKWMKQMAAQTQAVVTGSVIIGDSGKYFNRLLWATPEGGISYYDKRHLFSMAQEKLYYEPGKENKIFNLKGWNILPQICYDLRFPVWSRNSFNENGKEWYDLVFYIASWPASRIAAWDILLKGRAVENLSYAIGVNRIGKDGNGVVYNGHSGAYNFKGETMVFSNHGEAVLVVDLDYQKLVAFREKFPALKDADGFELHP